MERRRVTPEELLKACEEIQKKKRADYSSKGIHENFERCEEVISWFKNDIDKVYATLVAVKLARLAVLLSSDKEPNNESIQDSFIDLTNYCALWGSKRSGYSIHDDHEIHTGIVNTYRESFVHELHRFPDTDDKI